jgi:hypothetical protein
MIVFVRGKVVQAISNVSPNSLGDLLIEREVIGAFELEQALIAQRATQPVRLLVSLLVEMGFVERRVLNARVREQIVHALGTFLQLRRGSFEMKLNAVPIGRSRPYPGQDFVLTEGCDVEELLLDIATALDEARRDNTVSTGPLPKLSTGELVRAPGSSPFEGVERVGDFTPTVNAEADEAPELLLAKLDPGGAARRESPATRPPLSDRERFTRLHALLNELKHQTAHGEVALTIMRYATEVASRGVLFVVKDQEIWGKGQFGIRTPDGSDGKGADARVREIRVPLSEPSLLRDVVERRQLRVGRFERAGANLRILEKIGGADVDLIAAALPMTVRGRVAVILYVDNYPGDREFRGLAELEVLVDQAGVVMEKILLEQRLQEIELNLEGREL